MEGGGGARGGARVVRPCYTSQPQTMLFITLLVVRTACCRRMFVQQHEALSQVFMPLCEHAQNPTYSVFVSLYDMRLSEYAYSWVWRSQLGPKEDAITWGQCANMGPPN